MRRAGLCAAWALVAALANDAAAGELKIQPGNGVVEVSAGDAHWTLSTTAFDVIHAATLRGQPRLGPGRSTVDALGGVVTFGAPSETKTGSDWVELRGWADKSKHLWYVARYQFFAARPYARLILQLSDRHDESPEAEPSGKYWQNRRFGPWRLEVGAPGGKPASITQHNSYSASAPGAPWMDVVGVHGSAAQWSRSEDGRFQLVHGARDGANQVIWHPMVEGNAELTALITALTGGSAYRAAKAVKYEIVDAKGVTQTKVVAQTSDAIKLGTFALGKNSVVRLLATGSGEELALAGALRVAPAGGRPFEIAPGLRFDGVLSDGPLTIAVKDFWQHHPITVFRTDRTVGWQAIEKPAEYTGGMGVTIETMIALDGPAKAVSAALYAPPPRALPPRWHSVDGTLAKGAFAARYDALVKLFAERWMHDLERSDSFGWRNWGDYQIGVSYSDAAGVPFEDWANLQYDLPTGLLLAWLRTGDPGLWRFAQASIRHLTDLDLVKFSPFLDKMNGLVYRKGEMPRSRSHIGAEPITDQGFAWRALLLYYQLTGEEWAKELAKQNLDRLVYYAVTRPQFVLEGDRPTGWMLRAALAGAEYWPRDPHNYQLVADGIVRQLVDYYHANGVLPGKQPVWQGQTVEGLAEYQRRTKRTDVADVVVGQVRHMLTDLTRKKADGTYEMLYCHTPHGSFCPQAQWTDEDNYIFLWLGSISFAYELSHDPFFGKWADTLFTYAEAKMRQHNDIRSWTSVLGFPHELLTLPSVR